MVIDGIDGGREGKVHLRRRLSLGPLADGGSERSGD